MFLRIWKAIFKPKQLVVIVPDAIIEHLKLREGVRDYVYADSLGKLTVGVGHLVLPEDNLKKGQKISQERIDEFLRKDSLKAYNAALEQARELDLAHNFEVVLILTSVCFQLGTAWRSKFSNTWNHIKNREYDQAISNLKKSLWYKQTPVRVKDFINVLKTLEEK